MYYEGKLVRVKFRMTTDIIKAHEPDINGVCYYKRFICYYCRINLCRKLSNLKIRTSV